MKTIPLAAVPRLSRGSVLGGVGVLMFCAATAAIGGSASWKASPGSGKWNTAANGTPATIPNGTADIATFAFSNITRVFFAADTEVNGIVFNAGPVHSHLSTRRRRSPSAAIVGAVNVGNGVATRAVLLPGTAGTPGNLTINNRLTFNPLSTYECVLDRPIPKVGNVNALGVIIHSGVTFEFGIEPREH